MERDSIKHSAEGTHWQKKNHKYIRKEGNRYIYPSDLKKLENTASKRQSAVNSQGSTNYKQLGIQRANRRHAANGVAEQYRMNDGTYFQEYGQSDQAFAKKQGKYAANKMRENKSTNELKRSNATYQQNSQDYKKLSKQKANRTAAASGKVVNPGYVIKGSDGKVLGRGNTNRNYASPTTADYKEYSQLTAGHKNRRKNLAKQGSPDYKELSKQQAQKTNRANAANGARGTFEKGHMSDQDYQKKYAKSQSDAGKRKRAAGVHSNFNQQYAKSIAQYGPESAKRKLAQKNGRKLLNEQGSYSKNDAQSTRSFSKSYAKNHNMDSYKAENQNLIKNSSKKLKENGYFTVQNGKTVFVPSDKITMKKVSKGRQVINKIFNKFFKKK